MCWAIEEGMRTNKDNSHVDGRWFQLSRYALELTISWGKSQHPKINNRFLEMVQNCSLEQVVTFHTRLEYTLDTFWPTDKPCSHVQVHRYTCTRKVRPLYSVHRVSRTCIEEQTNIEKDTYNVFGNVQIQTRWKRNLTPFHPRLPLNITSHQAKMKCGRIVPTI